LLLEDAEVDEDAITKSLEDMLMKVQEYVPGYKLKNAPVFEQRDTPEGKRAMLVMLLEVTGAGDWLPNYAGNLDIMTASARQVGEVFAQHLLQKEGSAA
jgi:acetaldehyde dehydrogenase